MIFFRLTSSSFEKFRTLKSSKNEYFRALKFQNNDDFRALKHSKNEDFRALKSSNFVSNFRALKSSKREDFRALKSSKSSTESICLIQRNKQMEWFPRKGSKSKPGRTHISWLFSYGPFCHVIERGRCSHHEFRYFAKFV